MGSNENLQNRMFNSGDGIEPQVGVVPRFLKYPFWPHFLPPKRATLRSKNPKFRSTLNSPPSSLDLPSYIEVASAATVAAEKKTGELH